MLKNEVNYKALAFLAEQTASTFNYDVKGARALWDPSLSIPGTNRRGGWRCPVGTRYGGQITDRYGRSCGWGVARRIANQIADIGERLENVDDRKRNARLAKRNARVQRFLARQDKPGLLERGARGLADALDGGATGKPVTTPRAPARPRIAVQNPARIEPPARPRIPVGGDAEQPAREPARAPRRRGNLRESEARRMDREIVQPGAPRTGEPPAPNAPRRRRRNATQQGAKRTVRRKPEADFVDGSKPVPTKVPRRKPAPKPPERPAEQSSPIPPPPAWNPTADELGGSIPDDRSIRNVVNRFGDLRGLPEDAYWRKPDFPEGEEKAELERRFGRYYDDNNKRNARGNFVNQQIFGQQAGAPQPEPEAPARRAGPPPLPARDINPRREFDQQRDEALVKAVEGEIERYKPNAYNNLRNMSKEEILGKKIRDQELLKEAQAGFDRAFEDWQSKKNGSERERDEARDNLLRMWGQKEKIKDGVSAAELRLAEIDAAIEFRQRNQVVVPNNNVNDQNAPRVQQPAQPPQRPADIPEPEGGWDVSPPKAKDGHAPEKLNKLGEDGLPDVKSVPLGNKGMDTKEQAIDHLEKGGDLADVPDELLGEALHGATTRFSKSDAGGGVNGNIPNNMHMFTDAITGNKFFLKYQSGAHAENEDIHEVIGNNLAGRLGMPIGGVRMDGKQKGGPGAPNSAGRAIVYEHAGNYVDGALTDGRNQVAVSQIKPADRVRATLLDYIMVNRDRHGGNFFVATDSSGKKRFVPIDPSLGFDVNWGGRAHENYDGNDEGLRGFLGNDVGGRRNEMLATLRQQFKDRQISRREILLAVEEVQKSIREAERKNPYMNVVEDVLKAGGDGTANPRGGDQALLRVGVKPQRKMKYITDVDPGRLADLIIGS
jgi:hypothetical protein